MTDVAGVLAYLLLPLAGIAVWRLESVRALALDGRLAIAGAAGAVFMTLVMAVMSSIGLEWSRTRLTIVLLLGSVQLFVTGVFGEYLGRLYLESKRRPLFVVREVVRSPAKAVEMDLAADVSMIEQHRHGRSF